MTSVFGQNVRVHFVAAPLMARSGVYNSLFDLIEQAQRDGMPWTGTLGMRPDAPGTVREHSAVSTVDLHLHGLPVVSEIREMLASDDNYARADWVVTLITQSDMALFLDTMAGRRSRSTWIAYIRGLPWPARGEQSEARRQTMRVLETVALRRAREVWVTTETLAEDVRPWAKPRIVRAGIKALPRMNTSTDAAGPLVWAGRLDVDKRPELFAEICTLSGHSGRIYGDGPMRGQLQASVSGRCEVMGWAKPDQMWSGASLFVGTSYREAFGRSAVEASLAGLPVVIGDRYGAARLLVTDPEVAELCIVDSADATEWARVVRRLLDDPDLLRRVAEHVHENALQLTIKNSVARISDRISELSASAQQSAALIAHKSED